MFEMNCVTQSSGVSFLFADPFSWSSAAAPDERWLGGTTTGKYAGRGLVNVRALLTSKEPRPEDAALICPPKGDLST